MYNFSVRMLRLFFGLFLYALGIVVTMNANIGFAPWEVFHKGIANIYNSWLFNLCIGTFDGGKTWFRYTF
jgi:hypothetical protein